MRRYVSLLYIGASRAERVLELYCSEERGGPTRALKYAIDGGALDILDIQDIE
jgi:ATP-dependent exoDNAse (exonuclease V) alpha subunit